MRLQLCGLRPLRFSSLEFIISRIIQTKVKKPRPKFGVTEIINLRGSDSEVKTEGGLQ